MGIGTGIIILQSYDQVASPLVYQGFGLPLAPHISLQGDRWRHQLDLNMTSSKLTNAYSMQSEASSRLSTWHWLNAKYAFSYKLKDGPALDHCIGGNLRSLLFYREYAHLDGYSWEAINGLYFGYHTNYRLNQHHFRFGVNLPLVAYLHRPEYTVDERFLEDLFKKQGVLKYGHYAMPFQDFWHYGIYMTYGYDLTEIFKIEVTLDWEQYRVEYPQISQSITFQALTQIMYLF